MRYGNVFLLHLQDALDDKGRMFVWFLVSLINPLVLLLFWKGASGWNVSEAVSYYVLLIIANTFLSVHIEEVVAYIDIQEGYLSNYLIKPVSYVTYKFFHELPYRVLESVFAVLFIAVFFGVAKPSLAAFYDSASVGLFLVVFVLAYCMSFLFKMILGLTALWTTDFSGLAQLVQVVIITTGGFIMPIALYPDVLQRITYALPFPYMFYVPVAAFLGYFSRVELLRIIFAQGVWLAALYGLFHLVWRSGVRRFTGIGR